MTIECLLAALLLAAPVLSRAADANAPPMGTPTGSPSSAPSGTPAPKGPTTGLAALNSAIDRMMTDYGKTEDCFKTESSLRADLARKKAQLSAEFKGAIPNAFDDLLWQKTARINRWHEFCVQSYDELGRLFESLALSIRTIEPKNTNIKRQVEAVNAQKTKYLQLRPTAKTYNKPQKPAEPE